MYTHIIYLHTHSRTHTEKWGRWQGLGHWQGGGDVIMVIGQCGDDRETVGDLSESRQQCQGIGNVVRLATSSSLK